MKCILLAAFLGHGLSRVEADRWTYSIIPSGTSGLRMSIESATIKSGQSNEFLHWLQHNVRNDPDDGVLSASFVNGSILSHTSWTDLIDRLNVPNHSPSSHGTAALPTVEYSSDRRAKSVFKGLEFPLDPRCISEFSNWWWRTYDGSCNWMKDGEARLGEYGTAKSRDYGQRYYEDGIETPRGGPNPRAVSNAFFKRKETLYYNHTPLLLGLVEFIMHDISWSEDSTEEYIDVTVPKDEKIYPLNTTMRVYRTQKVAGTGHSRDNPREIVNGATTWLDVSALYGSSSEVAQKLRSFSGGKLLSQELRASGSKSVSSYLPFNAMSVPTRTKPGVDTATLFAGGDPRTNEDWIMLAVHTLFLREHNRLCDILAAKQPEYDDEALYQTTRLLISAKFALIANAYQMAYFQNMTWPSDDGYPLFREMLGKTWLDINPANAYPWPIATRGGKPTVVSAEMAIIYRFHEFIINSFPIKDELNQTKWEQNVFETGFNATGFIATGLDNVVRGITSSTIPNFKSGVDESFRSAGVYRGRPFDIVVWSIVHEREQGLPTFNNYFREYNKAGPKVLVPIREKFEDFTSDEQMVKDLKRLYRSPDDVDLVVGCQLDETFFPHATVPTSSLIISLFSLMLLGNSDRFSIGFAAMRCLLVDKPWDCHPSNALEDLLWKRMPRPGFPNFRFYDPFWMNELDFQAHGKNLLWRMITENTDIKCLQKNPLFPWDEDDNPILCNDLPKASVDLKLLLSTGVEVTLSLLKEHRSIVATLAGIGLGLLLCIWAPWSLQSQSARLAEPSRK